jgi:hypothetical protein
MAELDEMLEAARNAGLEVRVERGLGSVVLTVNGRRWIMRDDAELSLVLAVHSAPAAQAAWQSRRSRLDSGLVR